jgi:hypothetical protein
VTASLDAVRGYLAAVAAPAPEALAALAAGLAEEVVVAGPLGAATGRDAVTTALTGLPSPRLLERATWSEPEVEGNLVTVEGVLPAGLTNAGMSIQFTLDGYGKITRIAQRNLPAPPPPVTELALTDGIRADVDGALGNGTPLVLAYVDASGAPRLSFRGSTQSYGRDQLAVWVRDPEGGLLKAIKSNPQVAMLYRDGQTRRSYQFSGRAWVEADPERRAEIYNRTPELERNLDAQRRGAAVIIDLDRVEGIGTTGRFRMARTALSGTG